MMDPVDIEGAQVELGRSQGFVPIKVRYEMVTDAGTGKTYPSMVCALMPSNEDRARILAGEPLELRIIGIDWPPVDVAVGLSPYDKQSADTAFAFVQGIHKQRAEERIAANVRKRTSEIVASLANLPKTPKA